MKAMLAGNVVRGFHFIQEELGEVQGNGSLYLQCQSCTKHIAIIDAE